MKHTFCLLLVASFGLISCNSTQYSETQGQPESLLDVSSERIVFSIASQSGVEEMIDWIQNDPPTKAELSCEENNQFCRDIINTFNLFAIPFTLADSESMTENSTVLVYERVIARDCNNRFYSNGNNPENQHYGAWGCATAVNYLQLVHDHAQFVRPELSADMDAAKAAVIYEQYRSGGN